MSRLLLATNHLLAWTGSEITVATLARVLSEAGHEVLVYAPFSSGPDFVGRLLAPCRSTTELADVVDFAPHAAYTQHHTVAISIRAALPSCPIAHAVLGVIPYLERPPRLDLSINTFLAISEEVRGVLLATGLEDSRISLFRNLVDDVAFDGTAANRALQTVACFSYKLDDADLKQLSSETSARGLRLLTQPPQYPGQTTHESVPSLMAQGEVVVASGRGAIEAMLCGRVPLILANCGDDGLVTPDNFHALMSVNFSGRYRGGKLSASAIGAELDAYRPELGAQLQRLAREYLGSTGRKSQVLDLFQDLAEAPAPALSAQAIEAIRFDSQGLQLQREFAIRSAAAQRAAVLSPADGSSTLARLKAGNLAWRFGDQSLAFDAYLQTFQSDQNSTAAGRSLASIVLVQLASRSHRSGNTQEHRQALEAFLVLNPGQAWAVDQLAKLDVKSAV
jgi:hypothetical protein